MPKTQYFVTGDNVPNTGNYATFCDNVLQNLTQGDQFPICPTCHMNASWRPA